MQYFAVTLGERTDPALMKPGQRVRSTLVLESRKEALLVPRQAVFEVDGKSVAYRLRRDGGFEPVVVRLGPSGPGRAVVEAGLAAGDRVALVDPVGRPEPEGGAAKEGAEPAEGGAP